jgi:hypothetical protein
VSTVWNDTDIPAMLTATGAVPCTIGGVAGICLFDLNDAIEIQDANRGQVVIGKPMLTVQTSAFPNLDIGQPVAVDGKTYTVRERLRVGDAGLTKLFLGDRNP